MRARTSATKPEPSCYELERREPEPYGERDSGCGNAVAHPLVRVNCLPGLCRRERVRGRLALDVDEVAGCVCEAQRQGEPLKAEPNERALPVLLGERGPDLALLVRMEPEAERFDRAGVTSISATYFANSTTRVSRTTVTLISPG